MYLMYFVLMFVAVDTHLLATRGRGLPSSLKSSNPEGSAFIPGDESEDDEEVEEVEEEEVNLDNMIVLNSDEDSS